MRREGMQRGEPPLPSEAERPRRAAGCGYAAHNLQLVLLAAGYGDSRGLRKRDCGGWKLWRCACGTAETVIWCSRL